MIRKYIEKNPMIMIVVGLLGVSMSAIFVRLSDAPSAVTAAYRLLWTVLLMTPVTLLKREPRRELARLGMKNLLLCAISGVFLAVHFTLWFESLQHTSVASSGVIVCTEVIWVAIGYCLFMGGKISLKAVAAIAVSLVGSVIIALSDSGGGGRHLYGDILSLLSAMAIAVYILIGRAVRKTVSNTVYTYAVYSVAAVTLVVISLAQGHSLAGHGIGAVIVGLLLAVFSTIMGHSVFNWCLKYFSPSFVSASKLAEPVLASVIAVFLFSEIPSAGQIFGGMIILAGVLAYSRFEKE